MGATSAPLDNLLWVAVVSASIAAVLVAGFQFPVGGKGRGWKLPTGNEPETYNSWAAKNRFLIGDTLHFEYEKDSVLVVNSADYLNCNTSNPISKFEDGNTIFKFEGSGLFHFISGQPGHCSSGQRLIVRVMHRTEVVSPSLSPSPAAGGDPSGGDGRQTVVSSSGKSVIPPMGLLAMVCLFMEGTIVGPLWIMN